MRRTLPAAALLLAAALAACSDDGLGRPAERPEFPPDIAWSFLTQQLAFGPRHPGHRGHEAQLAWLREQLEMRADTVLLQPFAHTAADGKALKLTNVIARFRPEAAERVLLVAHRDTRRYAEGARDPADRDRPVPGANDGAAPTAVLVALSEILAQQKPAVGVDLLFADGDDYGPGAGDLYRGTAHYLANLPAGAKPAYAIVLDLVGERKARFPREAGSRAAAPELVERVWGIAGQMRLDTVFTADTGRTARDERVRLLAAGGIAPVLINDPVYGPGNRFWGGVDDVIPLLDPETLGAVGEVVAEVVYRGIPAER
ncbi:MAG TPA: M28 family peptidase [Longimicrobium sp.]|nr:M28 family peptidase [Longimicrobium sp.]